MKKITPLVLITLFTLSFNLYGQTTWTSNMNSLDRLTSIKRYLKVSINDSQTSHNQLDNEVSISGYTGFFDNPPLLYLNELEKITPLGEKQRKNKNYKTWVSSLDNSFKYKGYLREVEDSSIVLTTHSNKLELNTITQSVYIRNVKYIQFRKEGKVGKGFLYGFVAGFIIGGTLGLIGGDDVPGQNCFDPNQSYNGFLGNVAYAIDESNTCYSAWEKAKIWSSIWGSSGAWFGALIASRKILIPIKGSQKYFTERKDDLLEYKIRN